MWPGAGEGRVCLEAGCHSGIPRSAVHLGLGLRWASVLFPPSSATSSAHGQGGGSLTAHCQFRECATKLESGKQFYDRRRYCVC